MAAPPRPGLRWWREVLLILAFYSVYSIVRNQFGSAAVPVVRAYHHALDVITFEEALGLFHERTIQHWFLSWSWFIRFWNIYYGTFHFIVTAGALVACFRLRPTRYGLWRNTLGATTGLALIGFSLFPLMPPRLLNSPTEYGAGVPGNPGAYATKDYGFHDTLEEVGGLWSFDSGTMKTLSNQYAAMPSLHCAWATWCTLVLWPLSKRRWARALLVLYPVATLFCIVVTANHYWIDGIGGLVTLAAGFLVGRAVTRFTWRLQHGTASIPA